MKKEELKQHLYELPYVLFNEIASAHYDGRLDEIIEEYLESMEKWEVN